LIISIFGFLRVHIDLAQSDRILELHHNKTEDFTGHH
jgi:hypothetical protein